MKESKEYIESKDKLLSLFKENNYTVYTVLNHCSQSGMTRHISCYIATHNKKYGARILNITWYVANLLGYKRNKSNGGLVVSGCGMDMGFSVVYNIGRCLYPKGFKSSQRNSMNGIKPTDKGYSWDNDGGYRLKQEWL